MGNFGLDCIGILVVLAVKRLNCCHQLSLFYVDFSIICKHFHAFWIPLGWSINIGNGCMQVHLYANSAGITIFRPPETVILSSPTYLSSFFIRYSPELTSQNSTKTGHMLGSECDLKMHVQNLGYPLPLNIGGPKTIVFLDDIVSLIVARI